VGRKRRKGEREREKRETKIRQPEQAGKGVQGRSATATTDPTMSSWLSLYAGIEIPERTGSGRKHPENKNKRPPEETVWSFYWVFAHVQSVYMYVQFVPHVLPA